MKQRIIVALLSLCLTFVGGSVFAEDDLHMEPSCKFCGMDRTKFAHSRMFVKYDDASTRGTCSLHCLAIELALNIDKAPVSIQVGDFNSKNLIDAEKASWVIGGNKPGVMTKQAKWAFEKKADAEKFIAENGGVLASFDEAIKAAYTDMYADSRMIREKRKMKKMKMHN
jgi:hypothetical protein